MLKFSQLFPLSVEIKIPLFSDNRMISRSDGYDLDIQINKKRVGYKANRYLTDFNRRFIIEDYNLVITNDRYAKAK